MAVQREAHPSAEVLKAFGLGKLPDSSSSVVMMHLDQCESCRQEVAALSGDDFLHRLRQAHGSTPAPAKPLAGIAAAKPAAAPAAIANLPPELANNPHYEVLRELGRGGMGVVYLARNRLMDRLEVLKVVNKTLLNRPGALERFLREIRAAAKLNHVNVVAAYHALQVGDLLAFAMEYVEGQDLASVVKAQGPLPIAHACFYIQQAAHGLQHAFEKGMVHRDIKPQNLILAREGRKHIVKVLDFGLAKATREKSDDASLTGEGRMLGTPDYIAPEQSLDAANADIRADIYSLGCTLYFLLAGRAPFSGTSLSAILLAHQMQEAKPLHVARPEVPEELAAVVAKMMAKSPAQRYQTPLEVVPALAPFVKQGTTAQASLELSPGTAEGKTPGKNALPVDPFVATTKKEQEPAASWESLTVGRITPLRPGQSGAVRPGRPTSAMTKTRKKWLMSGGLAVGLFLLALLGMAASVLLRVKTPDGTIIVANVPADAEVQVEGQTVTLTRNGDMVTISAVPKGPHKLKVVQGGRDIWSSDVTVKLDGNPIRLTCEPVAVVPPPPKPPPAAPKPAAEDRKKEDRKKEEVEIAKLRQVLLKHSWHYHDNLYPPGDQCRFNADGTFHVWRWQYWVVGPRTMRVHYDRNNHNSKTGILFTFNQELTQFTAQFTDPGGRVHKIIGTRQ